MWPWFACMSCCSSEQLFLPFPVPVMIIPPSVLCSQPSSFAAFLGCCFFVKAGAILTWIGYWIGRELSAAPPQEPGTDAYLLSSSIHLHDMGLGRAGSAEGDLSFAHSFTIKPQKGGPAEQSRWVRVAMSSRQSHLQNSLAQRISGKEG